MSEILVIKKLQPRFVWINDATDKWTPLVPKKTRRDVSKLGTGSRRQHNTRKIAIGGARLDSRLSDFRSATKSAENRERALNGRVSVFVFCPPPPSPFTSLLPPLYCRGKGNTARRTGLFKLSAALYSLHFFALYVYYIRWRAPPFFASHKDQTMTAARCVSSLMFYPSILLLYFLRKAFANSTQFHPFAHFFYIFLFRLFFDSFYTI